jgi:hypothetical protein
MMAFLKIILMQTSTTSILEKQFFPVSHKSYVVYERRYSTLLFDTVASTTTMTNSPSSTPPNSIEENVDGTFSAYHPSEHLIILLLYVTVIPLGFLAFAIAMNLLHRSGCISHVDAAELIAQCRRLTRRLSMVYAGAGHQNGDHIYGHRDLTSSAEKNNVNVTIAADHDFITPV